MGHLSGTDLSSEAMDSRLGETPKRSLSFERINGTVKLIQGGMNETYTENEVVSSKTKPMFEG